MHVTDISHPDQIAQRQNVLDTLGRLNIPDALKENIIEVGNKVDKLPRLINSCIKVSFKAVYSGNKENGTRFFPS